MAGIANSRGPRPAMVDAELAWELADTAKGHLDANQHNMVYVAIGVGDAFSAATFLLQRIVESGLAVRADLMLKLNRWVTSYRDHPEQARLRDLISRVRIEPFDEPCRVPAPPIILSTVTRYRRPNRTAPKRRTLSAGLSADRRAVPGHLHEQWVRDVKRRSSARQRVGSSGYESRNAQQ
jgi:hypothetical protein